MMLAARLEDGTPLCDEHLRDELVTMPVAGHETTAIALAWLVARLAGDEGARRAVKDELQSVVGDGPMTPAHPSKLPLLLAIIKESMRLDPDIPFVVRQLHAPLKAGPLHLPAGVVAAPGVYMSHRNPDLWPDPERFDPHALSRRARAAASLLSVPGRDADLRGDGVHVLRDDDRDGKALDELRVPGAGRIRAACRAAEHHVCAFRGRAGRRSVAVGLRRGYICELDSQP